ncbi:unnamed protein product [Amoebophrya sp. A120]|nr:unnamed protein product [Amoebophrya sp. A120]|eukprot:GSA120T00007838001.1
MVFPVTTSSGTAKGAPAFQSVLPGSNDSSSSKSHGTSNSRIQRILDAAKRPKSRDGGGGAGTAKRAVVSGEQGVVKYGTVDKITSSEILTTKLKEKQAGASSFPYPAPPPPSSVGSSYKTGGAMKPSSAAKPSAGAAGSSSATTPSTKKTTRPGSRDQKSSGSLRHFMSVLSSGSGMLGSAAAAGGGSAGSRNASSSTTPGQKSKAGAVVEASKVDNKEQGRERASSSGVVGGGTTKKIAQLEPLLVIPNISSAAAGAKKGQGSSSSSSKAGKNRTSTPSEINVKNPSPAALLNLLKSASGSSSTPVPAPIAGTNPTAATTRNKGSATAASPGPLLHKKTEDAPPPLFPPAKGSSTGSGALENKTHEQSAKSSKESSVQPPATRLPRRPRSSNQKRRAASSKDTSCSSSSWKEDELHAPSVQEGEGAVEVEEEVGKVEEESTQLMCIGGKPATTTLPPAVTPASTAATTGAKKIDDADETTKDTSATSSPGAAAAPSVTTAATGFAFADRVLAAYSTARPSSAGRGNGSRGRSRKPTEEQIKEQAASMASSSASTGEVEVETEIKGQGQVEQSSKIKSLIPSLDFKKVAAVAPPVPEIVMRTTEERQKSKTQHQVTAGAEPATSSPTEADVEPDVAVKTMSSMMSQEDKKQKTTSVATTPHAVATASASTEEEKVVGLGASTHVEEAKKPKDVVKKADGGTSKPSKPVREAFIDHFPPPPADLHAELMGSSSDSSPLGKTSRAAEDGPAGVVTGAGVSSSSEADKKADELKIETVTTEDLQDRKIDLVLGTVQDVLVTENTGSARSIGSKVQRRDLARTPSSTSTPPKGAAGASSASRAKGAQEHQEHDQQQVDKDDYNSHNSASAGSKISSSRVNSLPGSEQYDSMLDSMQLCEIVDPKTGMPKIVSKQEAAKIYATLNNNASSGAGVRGGAGSSVMRTRAGTGGAGGSAAGARAIALTAAKQRELASRQREATERLALPIAHQTKRLQLGTTTDSRPGTPAWVSNLVKTSRTREEAARRGVAPSPPNGRRKKWDESSRVGGNKKRKYPPGTPGGRCRSSGRSGYGFSNAERSRTPTYSGSRIVNSAGAAMNSRGFTFYSVDASPKSQHFGGEYYNQIASDNAYWVPTAEEKRRQVAWERHHAAEESARKREEERNEKIAELLKNLAIHGESVRPKLPLENDIKVDDVGAEDELDEAEQERIRSKVPAPAPLDVEVTPDDEGDNGTTVKPQATTETAEVGAKAESTTESTATAHQPQEAKMNPEDAITPKPMGLQEKQVIRNRLQEELRALEAGARGDQQDEKMKVGKNNAGKKEMKSMSSSKEGKKSSSSCDEVEESGDHSGVNTYSSEFLSEDKTEQEGPSDRDTKLKQQNQSVAPAADAGTLDKEKKTKKEVVKAQDKKPSSSSSSCSPGYTTPEEDEDEASSDSSQSSSSSPINPDEDEGPADEKRTSKTKNTKLGSPSILPENVHRHQIAAVEDLVAQARLRAKQKAEQQSSTDTLSRAGPEDKDDDDEQHESSATTKGENDDETEEKPHEIPLYCRFLQPTDPIYMQSKAFDPNSVPATSLMKLLNQSGTWYHEDPFDQPPKDTRCLCRDLNESFIWVEDDLPDSDDGAEHGEYPEGLPPGMSPEEYEEMMRMQYYHEMEQRGMGVGGPPRRAVSF